MFQWGFCKAYVWLQDYCACVIKRGKISAYKKFCKNYINKYLFYSLDYQNTNERHLSFISLLKNILEITFGV